MKVILEQAQGEIVEKKSRFIATIMPVETKEEAEQFVASMKKKYWDAKHNCSAYVLGEKNEIMHSSDDGEPSGTAGRPMLAVLTGQEIHNVAVVVTRYFGGVLLGTGGLVRAYQGAVNEALLHANIADQVPMREMTVTTDYGDMSKIQRFLELDRSIVMEGCEYEANVRILFLVPEGMQDEIMNKLIELTNGKAKIEQGKLRDEVI